MTTELTYGAMPDLLMGTGVAVHIEADQLGTVNQIIRLVSHHNGDTYPIKAALWPVRKGSTIKLLHENGNRWLDGPGWQMLCGYPSPEPEPSRPQGWHVEIDGHTILSATEAEVWASVPARKPLPIRQRGIWRPLRAIRKRLRTAGDAIAHRFGYVHEDEAGGW